MAVAAYRQRAQQGEAVEAPLDEPGRRVGQHERQAARTAMDVPQPVCGLLFEVSTRAKT